MKPARGSSASTPNRDIMRQTDFTQFTTRYEPETGSIWCWMQPEPLPCLNATLIEELFQFQLQLTSAHREQGTSKPGPFYHLVLASKIPGIYNLGGDLELFRQYIISGDEEGLRQYAYRTINLVISNISSLDLPIATIALVQGQALGGGFETALSCDVIIAERRAQLGFPEILFNLFPGMGAYNLLERRIGSALTERIILSGETYTAGDLYDMGVIDVLAENGEGLKATRDFMNSHRQTRRPARAMKKIRQIVNPISKESLCHIVDIWIEEAMALDKKDLVKMDRLLQLQKDIKSTKAIMHNHPELTPRQGEWRKITDIEFPLTTHLGEIISEDRRTNADRRQQQTTAMEQQQTLI